jgi:hypothetical protein
MNHVLTQPGPIAEVRAIKYEMSAIGHMWNLQLILKQNRPHRRFNLNNLIKLDQLASADVNLPEEALVVPVS